MKKIVLYTVIFIMSLILFSCNNPNADISESNNSNQSSIEEAGIIIKNDNRAVFDLNNEEAHLFDYKKSENQIITIFNNKIKSEISIFFSGKNNKEVIENLVIETKSETVLNVDNFIDDEYIISIKIKTGDSIKYYISDYEGVKYFLKDENLTGNEMIFINDISGTKININTPFILNTNNKILKLDELIFSSSSNGFMQIKNNADNLDIHKLFIDTLNWEYDINYKFSTLNYVDSAYYNRCKSINGIHNDSKTIPVTSVENLKNLLDEEKYPILYSNDIIYFSGDFITESNNDNEVFTFNKPVSLNFNGANIKAKFKIRTHDKAIIDIKGIDHEYLYLETPDCDIIWTDCTLNSKTFFEKMNVQSFNGEQNSLMLGGKGQKNIESLYSKIDKEEIIWYADGNVLIAYVEHSKPMSVFSSVELKYENAKTSLTFPDEVINADGTVNMTNEFILTITDEEGEYKKYIVKTKRKALKIPVIEITTEDKSTAIDREIYSTATFNIIYPDGNEVADKNIRIRGRGNSTWKWAKKPYRLKFDEKISFYGLDPNKDWVLTANYSDKSLFRNAVASEIGSFLTNMDFIPSFHPVDVFINGEYYGVYLLSEHIEIAKGRVEVSENDKLDTGYLLEVGGVKDDVHIENKDFFHSELVKFILVKTSNKHELTQEKFDFIKNYFQKADYAVKTLDNYDEYIDIPSLIDWFILHELSNNIDSSLRRSCFITKDENGKLKFGPPWDFDLAFGNFSKDNPYYNTWCSVGGDKETDYVSINWMNYLLKDPSFCEKLELRWNEVGELLLSKAIDKIDTTKELIYESQLQNFKVWKIHGKKVAYEPYRVANLKTYDEQIDYMKNFLIKRKAWMDKAVKQLPLK
ncbi:CotH kinase family protein [Eubacteriales bacterium OttesenSCG-928-G02]|nr:CotH kinase family protein [Eubacteriales bacterium OttesenSCG-928-G02]